MFHRKEFSAKAANIAEGDEEKVERVIGTPSAIYVEKGDRFSYVSAPLVDGGSIL